MNRSSSRLKPLAPKPDTFPSSLAARTNVVCSQNLNAFAGSHLGVPAGPLENVTSMDPKDYVWGVPQSQPGLYGGPAFASQPLYSPQGLYHPQQTFASLPGYSQAPAGFLQTASGLAGTLAMQAQRPAGVTMDLPGFPGVRASAPAMPAEVSQAIPISQPRKEQGLPSMQQMDDLLNTALDDDCIKKLLGEPNSGPSALEGNMFGPQAQGNASPCREDISSGPSHNSTVTGEAQQDCMNMDSGGHGVATSIARDLLDATDLHFPMEDTSVLESMSGLGDLDLHLLEGGALTEMETTSSMQCEAGTANTASVVVGRGLKRAKSDIGGVCHQEGQAEYNPLLNLELDDALASINGFLAKALSSVPEEKRQKAVEAIAALQQNATLQHPQSSHSTPDRELLLTEATPAASAQGAEAGLAKSNSFPRRKRSSPRLTGS